MSSPIESSELMPDRSALVHLFWRISVYYLVVTLMLVAVNFAAPGSLDLLPTGGVGAMTAEDSAVRDMEDALLGGDSDRVDELIANTENLNTRFTQARALILAMLGTIVLMLPVSWMYKSIHVKGIYDHSLDETALILPAVVAGIVLIVQHSLALAFSLAGIVAGVRFRRALSDTFDTLFIFVAIGVGIAAGVEALEIAAIMTVFFNYATIGVCLFGDGLESHHLANEKLIKRAKKEQALAEKQRAQDSAPD